MTDEPTPLNAAMDRLLRSLKGGDRQTTVTVFSRWAELVGDSVAAHVRPLKLDGGTLVVEVDDPAWATQMKFLEADLLDRLKGSGGMSVERIEIRVKRRR
jgi:predicted nucleic acid-binding Zn ribbon protein